MKDVPGVTSALAERVTGGRYIDVRIDREAAARYGLNVADVQSVVSAAIGGENVGETIEGRRRFPINVRYPRELRDSVEKLRTLPIVTEAGAQVPLSAVAAVGISDGPPALKSENARLSGWIYVDIRGRDLVSVVADAKRAVAAAGEAAARRLRPVVGSVRVPRARGEAAPRRRALHRRDHLRAALSHVPPIRRGGAASW